MHYSQLTLISICERKDEVASSWIIPGWIRNFLCKCPYNMKLKNRWSNAIEIYANVYIRLTIHSHQQQYIVRKSLGMRRSKRGRRFWTWRRRRRPTRRRRSNRSPGRKARAVFLGTFPESGGNWRSSSSWPWLGFWLMLGSRVRGLAETLRALERSLLMSLGVGLGRQFSCRLELPLAVD